MASLGYHMQARRLLPEIETMSEFVTTAAALLAKQSPCRSPQEAQARLAPLLEPAGGLRVLSFVNAHAVMLAWRDPGFRAALLAADLLLRDGVGMALLMRRAGLAPGLNMNGTDLIPQLLAQLPRQSRVALLGSREPALGQAAARLRMMGFEDLYTCDGFREEAEYIALLRESPPQLVILGMGMPKQERLALRLASDPVLAQQDMLVINGGAILDFLSGLTPRAPLWMRRSGGEWLFRLLREPRRMFRRYCINGALFWALSLIYARRLKTLGRQAKAR